MKLKSLFWTLAFASLAVSCADSLSDGSGNESNVNGIEGSKTYMTVSISSDATRATPSGGEEGDVPGGEIGDLNEYKVNDVTVILYTDASGNTPTAFTDDCKLIGAGYKDGIAQMETSSELWHSRTTATVTITVTDPEQKNSFDGKTYGVIAVTNLGDKDLLYNRINASDINTGAKLANFLQVNAWDNSKGFVMSTHNDKYNGASSIFDKVTLQAGVDPNKAPTASVHVERLAAKIRINEQEGVNDFIYTINSGAATEAKVRLDQVAIVNKLTSGSYLLKRVTEDVTDCYSALPTSADNDKFLGNENTDGNGFGINYVIDPWTRAKGTTAPSAGNLTARDALTGASLTSPYADATLSYDNDFVGNDYATMWNSYGSDVVNLSTYSGTFPLHLAYTQENTTSLAMQKNGYSTGALFKATYFPKKWAATTTAVAGGNTVGKVEAVDIDYNGGDDGTGYDAISSSTAPDDFKFYVYAGNIYKDYEAIFNEYVWTEQKPLDGNHDGTPIYSYSDFTAAGIVNVKVADLFKHLLAGYSDPFDYIDYLIDKYDTNKDGKYDSSDTGYAADKTFAAADAIETYLTDNQTEVNAVAVPYENGVCYYPYWIRHASNGIPTKMSVMEFAIVRNNIYDMTVKEISGLGLSGAEKPDPGKDDEEDKYYFNVELYVKNWIVRNNNDIIL